MMQATDIVIAVRGTREFPIEVDFENCIESLVKYTTNYRLILVDDNSDEEGRRVVEKVASQFPTSVLIRTHTQNWFTRAYNKGLRMVKTPKAVALNADVICVDGWLDELYEVMKEVEAQPGQANKVGLVGHNGPGDGPEGARWMCTVPGRGYVTGHCWLLSMDALGKVAAWRRTPGYYLDETNPANAHIRSDIELCWRLNALGYHTVAAFWRKVGHLGGRSWGYRRAEVDCFTQQQLDQIDGVKSVTMPE